MDIFIMTDKTRSSAPKMKRALANISLIFTVTLCLLVILELALAYYYDHEDKAKYHASLDYNRYQADTYAGQQWPAEYYQEHREAYVSRWQPYVHWRRQPYQGKHINVNAQGIRKTWQENSLPKASNYDVDIYMFGGSTMWGTGARDEYTIPSQLTKLLANKNIYPQTINYGESSFTSSQGLLTLISELRSGKRPDVVIFYDGFNDATAALIQGEAGLPYNEHHRKSEYNVHKKSIATTFIDHLWSKLSIKRFTTSLSRYFSVTTRVEQTDVERAKLAKAVADYYIENLLMLQALAKQYQFTYFAYWQPNLFDKRQQSAYESSQKVSYQEMRLGSFYHQVNRYLEQSVVEKNYQGHFANISNVFAEVDAPMFVDLIHLGESGNLAIAEKMVDEVALALTQQ